MFASEELKSSESPNPNGPGKEDDEDFNPYELESDKRDSAQAAINNNNTKYVLDEKELPPPKKNSISFNFNSFLGPKKS